MANIIDTNLQFNSNYSKMKTVEGILLHHSGVTVLQTVETIHNYHKNKGWAGIGYHYYVRKDGSIYKGRPETMAGAHCPGVNSTSIGICAEGDFNVETMSEVQKQAIIDLIADIKSRYNITYIKGHRDILATSCPGDNFPFDEIVNGTANNTQTTKSIVDLANEVIAGKYGTGEARKQALGSLYNEVQAKVNEILLGNKTTETKKSIDTIADEVIAGKWGNGEDRKTRLQNAGYNYSEVQAAVNNKLSGKSTVSSKKSNEEIANEVIAGKWGNGQERKDKLATAGYDYKAIQKIVNQKM